MKSIKIIFIITICLFTLSSCDNPAVIQYQDTDHKYQYDEISSAVLDNEELFDQAVMDMDNANDQDIDRATLEKLGKLYKSKTDKAEISYFADTKKEPIEYAEILNDREVLSEFVDEYGEEVIDVFKKYKKIKGVYACYILDGEDYFAPVESEALEEVFKKAPVEMIWYDPDTIEFTCGEANVKENYFIGTKLIYVRNGEAPAIPDYYTDDPVEKDKGLLYEDESTFFYIEKLTDNYFFTSHSGWDA